MPTRDPDAPRWQNYARCARPDMNRDWWDASQSGGGRPTEAMHICLRHCPVVADCNTDAHRRAANGEPFKGVVAGGEHWNTDGKVAEHREPTSRCGASCVEAASRRTAVA